MQCAETPVYVEVPLPCFGLWATMPVPGVYFAGGFTFMPHLVTNRKRNYNFSGTDWDRSTPGGAVPIQSHTLWAPSHPAPHPVGPFPPTTTCGAFTIQPQAQWGLSYPVRQPVGPYLSSPTPAGAFPIQPDTRWGLSPSALGPVGPFPPSPIPGGVFPATSMPCRPI